MDHSAVLDLIWLAVIAFAIFAYVVMDGFDLGIGIIFPTLAVGSERDQAMNAIAPIWDGNETWLVLGGGGLLAAFPLAYSIILPATYPPVIAMLLGLVFRGVAFEFRWRDPGHRRYWDAAFMLGSSIAALAQGIILGAILQGIRVAHDSYAGGWLDWLSPFTLLTGVSLVLGYALLGTTWLVWKTEGSGQAHARQLAAKLGRGDSGGHGCGERRHPVSAVRLLAALVFHPQHPDHRPGAPAGGHHFGDFLQESAARRGTAAVPDGAGAVPAEFYRSGHQHVPLPGAPNGQPVGCGCSASKARRSC